MAGEKKRVFGVFEAVFDILYLAFALGLGVYMLRTSSGGPRTLAGVMALVLAGGDAFHLAPRIAAIWAGSEARFVRALGIGKFITSITMTAFYALLWHLGMRLIPGVHALWTDILYALLIIRVALCLPADNRWLSEKPPVKWGVIRNVPFFLMGAQVAVLFLMGDALPLMPLAILLSFLFYIPVVLFANEHPRIGMLMLPKTLAYVWILVMCAKNVN